MTPTLSRTAPAEYLMYQAHLHWVILLVPFVVGLLGLLVLATGLSLGFWPFVVLAALMLVVAVLQVSIAVIRYFLWKYEVTDRRVRISTGILRRRSLDLLLTKVESVAVDRPLLGQILGYGTLVVIGTGGTRERFAFIDAPETFRLAVYEQLETQGA